VRNSLASTGALNSISSRYTAALRRFSNESTTTSLPWRRIGRHVPHRRTDPLPRPSGLRWDHPALLSAVNGHARTVAGRPHAVHSRGHTRIDRDTPERIEVNSQVFIQPAGPRSRVHTASLESTHASPKPGPMRRGNDPCTCLGSAG
jgi:hypothetical protein